jgi:ribose transport system permease protein
MTQTRFGVHTLALGSSLTSAIRSGLQVRWHIMSLFVMMGLFSAIAGLIDFTRFATADITGHTTDALSAVAGAVIGGTSIFGGSVSVGGGVMGGVLAVIVDVGLVILNFDAFYQKIAIGVVLIAAVLVDQRRRLRRNASG